MTSEPIVLARSDELDLVDLTQVSQADRIIEFYDEAGMDYGHWSRGFNMHLGFYRAGLNPFDREKMLEQMNHEIAARLELDLVARAFLIDLGCGMGAVARSVAKNYLHATVKCVTNVQSQVRAAVRSNALECLQDQIEIVHGDYTALPYEDGYADGVWAVESLCYATGPAKADLVREMARVLRPGGRFAIADCFIKGPAKDLNFLIKKCYSSVCKSWALAEMPELDRVVTALKKHGFRDILAEDISWRVVPSLAHAPFAVISFLVKKVLAREPLKRHTISNLKASLLALALGLNRAKFSYCLISGRLG